MFKTNSYEITVKPMKNSEIDKARTEQLLYQTTHHIGCPVIPATQRVALLNIITRALSPVLLPGTTCTDSRLRSYPHHHHQKTVGVR